MKYFFDSSVLIDLTKNNKEVIEKIKKLSDEKDSELYTNNLVRLEVLRGINFYSSQKYKTVKNTLSSFVILELNDEIYDKAVNFLRFCKKIGLTLKGKCEAIDFLHFITAKHYDLEIISNDKDFDKLEKKYQDYQKNGKTLKNKKP